MPHPSPAVVETVQWLVPAGLLPLSPKLVLMHVALSATSPMACGGNLPEMTPKPSMAILASRPRTQRENARRVIREVHLDPRETRGQDPGR